MSEENNNDNVLNTEGTTNEGQGSTGKAATKKTAKTTAKKTEKVEVSADVLNDVLGRLKNLETENTALRQAQTEFESTASQDQIAKIEKLRASGKLVKSVRINFYDNKPVTSWVATEDDVFIETGTGKEIAVQKTKLTFADGKTRELPQLEFARRKLQREYEVIKEGKDKEGHMLYTVIMEGGEEMEIDSRYIN